MDKTSCRQGCALRESNTLLVKPPRNRRVLFLLALAIIASPAMDARAGASHTVHAHFRRGVHLVDVYGYSTVASTWGNRIGVEASQTMYVSVGWTRTDHKGVPFFESASGRLPSEVDPVTGSVRVRGRMPEFFHDGFVKIDVTFEGEPSPLASARTRLPSEYGTSAGAGASAGMEWIGSATGVLRSSLGTVKDSIGTARMAVTVGADRYVGI